MNYVDFLIDYILNNTEGSDPSTVTQVLTEFSNVTSDRRFSVNAAWIINKIKELNSDKHIVFDMAYAGQVAYLDMAVIELVVFSIGENCGAFYHNTMTDEMYQMDCTFDKLSAVDVFLCSEAMREVAPAENDKVVDSYLDSHCETIRDQLDEFLRLVTVAGLDVDVVADNILDFIYRANSMCVNAVAEVIRQDLS